MSAKALFGLKRRVSAFLAIMVLAGCTPQGTSNVKGANRSPGSSSVTVMTFNVENLFNTTHDAGKDDYTYLPVSRKRTAEHVTRCNTIEVELWRNDCLELDWSEEAVEFKLRQLGKTILQINDGKGPDILALQEVENIEILTRLSQEYLQAAGYGKPILIEGQDLRGIDVAFLSRLPLATEPVLHAFDAPAFPDRIKDTRGVLEATFQLPGGGRLTGFCVHFPAPFHPIDMREVAYDHLNTLRSRVPADQPVFAAGDFNTPAREMTGTSIMDDRVRPYWTVAHEADCEGCLGTNYWSRGQTWSFLDMILFSETEAENGWHIPKGGVFIADGYGDQLNPDGTVNRFNLENRRGVSDHLPLVMTLNRAKRN
ncbi:MAG: endonuclease/exonuclease/phosphatase family protein [Pseudomonadota bacterium]